MKTGLTKQQKTTEIYFDELPNGRIAVCTHNTDLKKRLTAFAEQYPNHCTMTDEDTETAVHKLLVRYLRHRMEVCL